MRENLSNLNGHHVLQLLYSRSGMSWRQLSSEFGFEDVNAMPLLWCMHALADVDLITVDGVSKDDLPDFLQNCLRDYIGKLDQNKIRASNHWRHLQATLFGAFDDMPHSRPELDAPLPYSMSISPVFGPPTGLTAVMQVFVAMPFDKALDAVYTHIRSAAQSLYLSCGRSDDIFSANAVLHDVWSALCGASAVVGECTGRNPNVFYELGIAHTLGKPVVLITQDTADVPFDVRHVRFIKYSRTSKGRQQLEESLRETLKMAISTLT